MPQGTVTQSGQMASAACWGEAATLRAQSPQQQATAVR
jgi:hypothetical protein